MKRMLIGYVNARISLVRHTHLTIYISSFVTTLHSTVVTFYAVESNSYTFQVASSSGNLLRSDSECTRFRSTLTSFYIGVDTHVCISFLDYYFDKNLIRNWFTSMNRIYYRNIFYALPFQNLSLSLSLFLNVFNVF